MRIYTKTGDAGETTLFAGPRVPKDHIRIEAYGTVDELNAVLGLARCESPDAELNGLLAELQNDLFAVGAELATPDPVAHGTRWIGGPDITRLETWIDRLEGELPALREFILPDGNRLASTLHVARATCRRAERRVVTLARTPGQGVSHQLIVYLNRLGDLLFVLSRVANRRGGVKETPWTKPNRVDAAT